MAEENIGTMGAAGEINIKNEMMTQAMQAIATYQESVKNTYKTLTETVEGVKGSFEGAASKGYQNFYETQIKAMLEPETGNLAKLLSVLNDICDSALKQLPGDEGVDAELAKINSQNSGDGQAAATN